LLLECRDTFQPGQWRDHGQQQVQLSVLRYERLDKQHTFLRVEASAEVVNGNFLYRFSYLRRIRITSREGMPIRNKIETLVRLLHIYPVLESSEEIAQVRFTRGPHTAEDPLFGHDASLL